MGQAAIRTDSKLGITERAEFIGSGADLMFACTHVPQGRVLGAVVICSSILNDFHTNYLREVLLAREFARHGVAAVRFHYRGMGHSDGDRFALTYEGFLADAAEATEHMLRQAPSARVGFFGTRWGAFAAASAASKHAGAPLAFWEPTLEPRQFFREGVRANLATNVAHGAADVARPSLEEQFELTGSADLVSHTLPKSLHESSKDKTLAAELGEHARPLLLVQFGWSPDLKRPYGNLVRDLTARGFAVTTKTRGAVEPWWMERTAPPSDRAVIADTAQWLMSELAVDR